MHIRLALLMFVEDRWEGDLYMLNFFLRPTYYRFLMGNENRLLDKILTFDWTFHTFFPPYQAKLWDRVE